MPPADVEPPAAGGCDAKKPVAIIAQTPAPQWTPMAPTGSSICSRSTSSMAKSMLYKLLTLFRKPVDILNYLE